MPSTDELVRQIHDREAITAVIHAAPVPPTRAISSCR